MDSCCGLATRFMRRFRLFAPITHWGLNDDPHQKGTIMTEQQCDSCAENAVADCQWGSKAIPLQIGSFCQTHLDELSRMLGPLLKINHAWLRVDLPGVIKTEQLIATAKTAGKEQS